MKGQLWYKSHEDDFSRRIQDDMEIFTEPPGSQSKSGYHLVLKTDLPKPSEPSPPVQVAPRTLLEVRSHYWQTDIGHLGKAVGQLLISGYVDYGRCQRLMQHLAGLAEVCGKLHQELQCIPVDTLRRSDGAVASQK